MGQLLYYKFTTTGLIITCYLLLLPKIIWLLFGMTIQGNENKIDEYALKQSLAQSSVWWYGDRDDEHGELYFRVQSDRYLIELLQSNTFGVVSNDVEANHVHSSFRDLKNDWDRDSLEDHWQKFHAPRLFCIDNSCLLKLLEYYIFRRW